jgi:hypothetical protein
MQEWEEGTRNAETTRINIEDEDSVFSVFVTYVEIYNNCVYDLLDESVDEASRLRY